MGNSGSSGGGGIGSHRRRSRGHTPVHPPPLPPPAANPQPEINGNHYVFAAATPYPPQYPNRNPPQYYQYTGYYPPPPPTMPMPMPAPYDHHHRGGAPLHAEPPPPYVEHQEAVTIRNDVNLKKGTLRMELDQDHPDHYLVAFTFDATVAGSITIYFFAKEENECNFTPTKESIQPITVSFDQGLGQVFRQPSGTGIDLSTLDETELLKEGDTEIYPLAVKAEASPLGISESGSGSPSPKPTNSQITLAVFKKNEKGECHVRVVKQILWVNNSRYELQEIYGIGNTVDTDFEGNDPGKECVICLTEPRDTTVLPCRHMCMCSGCAKVLRFQTHRCPICRQPVERLLEIKVNRPDE